MSNPVVNLFVNDNGFNAKIKNAAKVFASLGGAAINAKTQFSKFADSIGQVTQMQQAFNAAVKGNPYGLLAQAATVAFTKIIDKATQATDAEKRAMEWAEQAAERQQSVNEAIGRSTGELMAKYESLRYSWNALSNDQQKADWIKNNTSAFKSLNLVVNDINTAENVFVKNSGQVVAALKARAEAEAYGELYKEQIKKNAMDEATGKYKSRRASANVRDSINEKKAGITDADINWNYRNAVDENGNSISIPVFGSYKNSGVKKLQDIYNLGSASNQGAGRMQAEYWANMMSQAQARANALGVGLFGSAGGNSGGGGANEKALTEMQSLQNKIKELEQEYITLGDIQSTEAAKRRDEIQNEIAANDRRLNQLKLYQQQAYGKLQGGDVQETGLGSTQSFSDKSYLNIGAGLSDEVMQKVKVLQQSGISASEAWKRAGTAVGLFGTAISAIKDPAAQVAATVAQAIASIALAYSQALAEDQSTKPNIFAFLAASAAAMVSMVTTIAQIRSSTSGYAQGGIVDGNSYSGDNIPIMANAGELVLTKAAQASLANHLEGGGMSGLGPSRISGEQIYITLNRYLKRSGQGELMTWG